MHETLVIGDPVTLAHGGQQMTVEEIGPDGVLCTWIHDGVTKRDVFTAAMLRKLQPSQARAPLFIR